VDFGAFLQRGHKGSGEGVIDMARLEHTGAGRGRGDGRGAQAGGGLQDAARLAQGFFQHILRQTGGKGLGQLGILRGVSKSFQHFGRRQLGNPEQVRGGPGGLHIPQGRDRKRQRWAPGRAEHVPQARFGGDEAPGFCGFEEVGIGFRCHWVGLRAESVEGRVPVERQRRKPGQGPRLRCIACIRRMD
jgi:hypothetical protein